MNNEQNEEVIIEPQETNEEIVLDTEPEEVSEEVSEEVIEQKKPEETPEAKLARLKRQLEQHEKKMGIVAKPPVKMDKDTSLSPLDIIAISKADIAEDDISEVLDFAKYKGISVSEALKSPVVKNTLAQKKEERTVAQATNTGSARRGTSKVTDDKLLANANSGILPESDEDIARLYQLRKRR